MTAPQPPQYPGFGPQPVPQPPQKQRHVGRWILMTLGGLFVVVIAVAVSPHATPANSPQPTGTPGQGTPAAPVQDTPAVHHVVYKVTGSAPSASVTYNSDGLTSIQQEQGVPVPWTKELDVPAGRALTIVQVSAQNGGGGTITCTVTVDGRQVKTATSTGQYAIASCSGSIS